MKKITVKLERTQLLKPLVHALYPYYGIGLTYTISPPVELPPGPLEHSGTLKSFADIGMIIRVVPNKVGSLTTQLRVFVSQPGEQQGVSYYNDVKAHLQADLCDAFKKDPASFDTIVRTLIIPAPPVARLR